MVGASLSDCVATLRTHRLSSTHLAAVNLLASSAVESVIVRPISACGSDSVLGHSKDSFRIFHGLTARAFHTG
ncbi:hypothetical protein GE061_014594 [Apolygus lucorum]|uniref:Uncharacterized protein n=1 Tax=Apolygus lucorum TaxID=248454 RepID=A0A8S9XIN0_APOLU|nr:hypothetical protein GE061_014594 [Apolygus lucorum]